MQQDLKYFLENKCNIVIYIFFIISRDLKTLPGAVQWCAE